MPAPATVAFGDLGGWPGLLRRLFAGGRLGTDEAAAACAELVAGRAAAPQAGARRAAPGARG